MATPSESGRYVDRAVLLLLLGVLLFSLPVLGLGERITHLWYLPYVLWFLLILLAAWLQRLRDHE